MTSARAPRNTSAQPGDRYGVTSRCLGNDHDISVAGSWRDVTLQKTYPLQTCYEHNMLSLLHAVCLKVLVLFFFPFIAFGPRICHICAISGTKVLCHYVFYSGYFEVKTLTVRSVKVYFLSVSLITTFRWLIFIAFLYDVTVAKGSERTTLLLVHFLIRNYEVCCLLSHKCLYNLVRMLAVKTAH